MVAGVRVRRSLARTEDDLDVTYAAKGLRAIYDKTDGSGIVCDFYRKMTSGEAEAEAELFWRNRQSVLLRLLVRP